MTTRRPLVLTTGGCGFIGSHTIVELLKAGYDTVIVDNFSNCKEECHRRLEKVCGTNIILRKLDLLDKDALSALFTEFKFDHVIHFAALKAVGESVAIPLRYYENNVVGMLNLLQVMAAHNLKSIVYSSSATVYGTPATLPVVETMPTGVCTNPYGVTKLIGELILQDLVTSDPEWSVLSLRYFNPGGAHKSGLIGEDAGMSPKNIFPCLFMVAEGKLPEVTVFGNDYPTRDGTGVRDYVHVVDVAMGHVAALRNLPKMHGFKAYNLGTGQGYSVLELIKAMEKASGKPIAYRICPRRVGDVAEVFSDVSLIAKELGWKAEKGLDEMCQDAWRWQHQNPNGYTTSSENH